MDRSLIYFILILLIVWLLLDMFYGRKLIQRLAETLVKGVSNE